MEDKNTIDNHGQLRRSRLSNGFASLYFVSIVEEMFIPAVVIIPRLEAFAPVRFSQVSLPLSSIILSTTSL